MQTLYLHIGTHKTGTTTIQAFMDRARDALKEQGVLYPRGGQPSSPVLWGHHMLAWSLTKTRGVTDDASWHTLYSELAAWKGHTIVLSAEDLWHLNDAGIDALRERLDGYNLEVILYLRRPLDFVVSYYKQCIRHGSYSKSFRQNMRKQVPRLDYAALIERWERALGTGKVHVRLFDKVKRSPGLEVDFANIIGADTEPLRPFMGNAMNTSPDDKTIQILRWRNVCTEALRKVRAPEPVVRKAGQVVSYRLQHGPLERLARVCTRQALCTEADRAWLHAALDETMKNFLERHVSQEDWDLFQW